MIRVSAYTSLGSTVKSSFFGNFHATASAPVADGGLELQGRAPIDAPSCKRYAVPIRSGLQCSITAVRFGLLEKTVTEAPDGHIALVRIGRAPGSELRMWQRPLTWGCSLGREGQVLWMEETL